MCVNIIDIFIYTYIHNINVHTYFVSIYESSMNLPYEYRGRDHSTTPHLHVDMEKKLKKLQCFAVYIRNSDTNDLNNTTGDERRSD